MFYLIFLMQYFIFTNNQEANYSNKILKTEYKYFFFNFFVYVKLFEFKFVFYLFLKTINEY